jgi:anti-sigma factor ChrR (cupin superfamily)
MMSPTSSPDPSRQPKTETTTIEELRRAYAGRPDWRDNGVQLARIDVGDADDPGRPLVFHTTFPPGFVSEAQTHGGHHVQIVLEGSLEVDGQIYGPGAVRRVPPSVADGPLVAGPEGVTMLTVLGDQRAGRG